MDNRKNLGPIIGAHNPSETPNPTVADPHPGSVSDGTHPEAGEGNQARKDGSGAKTQENDLKKKQASDPAVAPVGDPAGAA